MLDIILGLLIVTLAFAYLIFIWLLGKKEYRSLKNIKIGIVLSSALCFLFILQTIFDIVLERSAFSIGFDIFGALIFALYIALYFSSLKMAKDITPDEEGDKEERDQAEDSEKK